MMILLNYCFALIIWEAGGITSFYERPRYQISVLLDLAPLQYAIIAA
jgi:hypothetical protein